MTSVYLPNGPKEMQRNSNFLKTAMKQSHKHPFFKTLTVLFPKQKIKVISLALKDQYQCQLGTPSRASLKTTLRFQEYLCIYSKREKVTEIQFKSEL